MMGSSHVGSTLKLQGWLDNDDNVHLPSDNEDILEEDEAHVEAAERFEAQYNFRTEVRPTTSMSLAGVPAIPSIASPDCKVDIDCSKSENVLDARIG